MWGLVVRLSIVTIIVAAVGWWYVMPDPEQDVFDEELFPVNAVLSENNSEASEDHFGESQNQHISPVVNNIAGEEFIEPIRAAVDDAVVEEAVPEEEPVPVADLPEKVKNKVPFITQAPKAQWEDVRFQDACEEASLLMVHRWREDKGGLSKNKATDALEAMFAQEEQFFTPDTIDTSAEDTARFGESYFDDTFDVRTNISLEDLYQELAKGSLVIIPTNGKKLGNPYFTNGGPERHMLVITGYDLGKKEFITNDPGTKRGSGYRYDASILYNAIRDYPTGHKVPITGVRKAMIVVRK